MALPLPPPAQLGSTPTTLATDLQIAGVTTITVTSGVPAWDYSSDPPIPIFHLHSVVHPRGHSLSVGDKIAAFFARDTTDPESKDTLAIRGEISASHMVYSTEPSTHLHVRPRSPFSFAEQYSEFQPLFRGRPQSQLLLPFLDIHDPALHMRIWHAGPLFGQLIKGLTPTLLPAFLVHVDGRSLRGSGRPPTQLACPSPSRYQALAVARAQGFARINYYIFLSHHSHSLPERTSIPAARKALDVAKADVNKIENIQISPPQLSEVAKRIIGAGGKVVEVGTGLKGRLKRFWEELVQHRHELTEFISIDVHFDVHGDHDIGVNIDLVVEQVGQSPREREAEQLITASGGPEAVLQNPVLVERVSKILGENITASLRDALMQDFDTMMKENKRNFDLKIGDAARRIKRALRASSGNILKHLDSGPHDLILDPDVKEIWRRIHSHFEPKVRQQVREAAEDDPHVDEWTLPFLSKAMYSPAVADAIDSDGSGLISVEECNDFLEDRPEGWSVPKWLSYWAVVWLMSNEKYLGCINDTVVSIKKAYKQTRPENKEAIQKSEYMDWLDFLDPVILQSLNWGVSQNTPGLLSYSELCDVQDEYMAIEQRNIMQSLDYLNCALYDIGTLPSITGNDRIELAVMPLLHLILQWHLRAMEQASQETLGQHAFEVHKNTLNTILFAFNCRLNDLERGWKQMRMDVAAHVECFAGGMFSEWQKKRRNPSKNVRKLLAFWISTGGDPARHIDENSGWWDNIASHERLRPKNRGPADSNFGNFHHDLSRVVFSTSDGAASDTLTAIDRIATVEDKLEELSELLKSVASKLSEMQESEKRRREPPGRHRLRKGGRQRPVSSESSAKQHSSCIVA
ncbi:hypothetical protein CONPUDRAFT_159626 [Coniophora puteana RWD-64-598 SS2]|uniref:EF-hand domain-containing protein n=1 Tax=Coniophora puteana (strain RWD-64-598) TaxID=741705 RepID=A0A5M3M7S7_CONPW|nr:uncharacterized protein CONPUDRAFT_159626 [Coniophora puteana RWD-64-598 SS2]EIW74855.1 hypothetical protein CONPUDRAFT_159626 [Coniophora puteana RWD-64-598 SS2]